MKESTAESELAPSQSVTQSAPNETIALDVDHIAKRYSPYSVFGLKPRRENKTVDAVRDISLQVKEGEMIGLLGPNGAGKTTLLKMITTLIYPSSGRVSVHGVDIRKEPMRARAMMGLVTCDERSFFWRLTGRQNLDFFGRLYGLDKALTQQRSEELFTTLGLSHAADRPYQKYSSGMRQKLAIARGLMSDPRIIFYDEPTRSLDPLSTQMIRNWILEKRKRSPQQTHILATNQLSEAEKMCDRVYIINRGELIAKGTINEIRNLYPAQTHDKHVISYRGGAGHESISVESVEGLLDIGAELEESGSVHLRLTTLNGSEALSQVLKKLLAGGSTILGAQTEQVSFDEVFCSLVDDTQERPSDNAAEISR